MNKRALFVNPWILLLAGLPAAVCGQPVMPGESPREIADRYYREGIYDEARRFYALAEGRDYVAGVVGRSRSLAMVGEYAQAIEVCREALRTPRQDPEIAAQLAELLMQTGRLEEARSLLSEIVQLSAPPLRALLLKGRLAHREGARSEARSHFEAIADRLERGGEADSAGLTMAAEAYRELERYHDANRLFREAVRADPANLEARTLWGRLYLAKYDRAHALETFEALLKQNRWYVPALVGAAASSRERERQGYLAAALEINPNSQEALALLAQDALLDYRFEQFEEYVRNVQEISGASLEASILRATQALMLGEREAFARIEAETLSRYPGLGEFYGRVADLLAQNYLFEEAEEMARKAVATDPAYWNGYTSLGMNLIRLGREEEGRGHLEFGFEKDPFNIWTSNMLQAFDTLEEYETRTSEHFVARMTQRDATLLWPYLEPLLEESWNTLTAKYRFTPRYPILVEVFDRSSDFAVRSLGLPDIGPLVGICFGRVITLISPSTLSANWGEIVWHEFTHVITLQMTRNRLPRWLSEGISVAEANVGRPEWGRNQDLDLIRAVQSQRLLPVEQLNDGFSGAESSEDLGFAYYQSYLVVQHVLERYGFDRLRALVAAHAAIRPLREIVPEVFGVGMASFEQGFRAWIDERVAAIGVHVDPGDPVDRGPGHGHGVPRNPSVVLAEIYSRDSIIGRMRERIAEHPNDFQAQLQLGIALYQGAEYEEARVHLEVARSLVPDYGGYPGPQQVLVELYEALGEEESKLRELESLVSFQHHDSNSLLELARHYWVAGDYTRSRDYLERSTLIDPYSLPMHEMLADVAARQEDYPAAVRELKLQLALDQSDPVEKRTELAALLLRSGDLAEARDTILAALEIAPTYERAQGILLQLVEKTHP